VLDNYGDVASLALATIRLTFVASCEPHKRAVAVGGATAAATNVQTGGATRSRRVAATLGCSRGSSAAGPKLGGSSGASRS